MSPTQCRAARAILGITQAVLAARAGITRATLNNFERQDRGGPDSAPRKTTSLATRMRIAAALEAEGIAFIREGGVRVRSGGC